jgi:hypothetical protein
MINIMIRCWLNRNDDSFYKKDFVVSQLSEFGLSLELVKNPIFLSNALNYMENLLQHLRLLFYLLMETSNKLFFSYTLKVITY